MGHLLAAHRAVLQAVAVDNVVLTLEIVFWSGLVWFGLLCFTVLAALPYLALPWFNFKSFIFFPLIYIHILLCGNISSFGV